MTLTYGFVTTMWSISCVAVLVFAFASLSGEKWAVLGFFFATLSVLFCGIIVVGTVDATVPINEQRIIFGGIFALVLLVPTLLGYVIGLAQASSWKSSNPNQEVTTPLPLED